MNPFSITNESESDYRPISAENAIKIFTHETLTYHFVPENNLPSDYATNDIFNNLHLQSGKYETGKYHLILKIIIPENITGISSNDWDIFHEIELIECIGHENNPFNGVYVFMAWGRSPSDANKYYDNQHHEGFKIQIDKHFLETKVIPYISTDERFPHEKLIKTIGFEHLVKACNSCGKLRLETKNDTSKITASNQIPLELGTPPNLNGIEYDVGFSDVNQNNPNGTLYQYKTTISSDDYTFCSNKCIIDFAVLENSIILYLDPEHKYNFRAICPDTLAINKGLHLPEKYKYRGQPSGNIDQLYTKFPVEFCELGISEKRKGNFKKALSLYAKARQYDSTFPHIYYNSAKILIGLGKYDLAFRHLLTVAHLNMVYQTNNIEDFEYHKDEYAWDQNISKTLNKSYFHYFISICSATESLKYFAVDINISKLAGLCYIMQNKHILDYHSIDEIHVLNYIMGLLGNAPNGQNFTSTEYDRLFNLIGFLYLIGNLKLDINKSIVQEIYFEDNFELKEIQ